MYPSCLPGEAPSSLRALAVQLHHCFQLHLERRQPPSRLVDDEHSSPVLKVGSESGDDDDDDGDSDGDNQKEKASQPSRKGQ